MSDFIPKSEGVYDKKMFQNGLTSNVNKSLKRKKKKKKDGLFPKNYHMSFGQNTPKLYYYFICSIEYLEMLLTNKKKEKKEKKVGHKKGIGNKDCQHLITNTSF